MKLQLFLFVYMCIIERSIIMQIPFCIEHRNLMISARPGSVKPEDHAVLVLAAAETLTSEFARPLSEQHLVNVC